MCSCMFGCTNTWIYDVLIWISKTLRFTIWKQKLSIRCNCWPHHMVHFNFSFRLILILLNYLLSSWIYSIIWFILRLPFFFSIFHNFCILFLCLLFCNYFQGCVFDPCNVLIFLTLQYFFKLARKIIVIKIFIISLISFHKVMTFIIHMLSHRLARTKIMSIFVLASDTHEANFNFFLEIFN